MTATRAAGERGPVVYVVQEPRFRDRVTREWKALDTTSLLDFGSVEVLLEPGAQVVLSAAPTVALLYRKLRGYRPQDYIVASGDPVAIGIACAIAAAVTGGSFTVLKWDNLEHRYFPVPVNLKGDL